VSRVTSSSILDHSGRPGWVAPGDPRLRKTALPEHLHDIRLPDGRQLSKLEPAEVARICVKAGIPGAGPDQGKLHNAQMLASTLEAIGREAAELAIASWLKERIG
jgi:hypothetical protein